MANMSFIDKLNVLFNITKSSMTYLIVIIMLVILASILMTLNKKNSKKARNFFIMIYVMIAVFLLVTYRSNLTNMFDYMMNNFFIAIYFPNLAVYLAAIIATNIILWTSISNPRTSKIVKKINILVFTVITYILVLILNTIKTNNLDVFTQTSVYGDKTAQALIELSSVIFIAWIIFLVLYSIIRKYIIRNRMPRRAVSRQPIKIEEPIIKDDLVPAEVVPVKEVKEKPYREIEPPYYVMASDNQIKVQKIKSETAEYENLLTIDDYKLLLDVLKKAKQEQIEKRKREEKIRLEEEKLRELRQIYQSIS
ncbi:MAG: hypothetical protein MR031_00145 [Tenericutes bacterium]|nr:hypothetical protein [Mycoplasmatota bacterium]